MFPRILIVEDHADTANAFSRLLCIEGYYVRVATCVRSAISLAKEDHFDLLVCDIGLPDGSGLDLMRELSLQYRMQGVAVSGFGMPTDITACRAAGFCEYVMKPATFEQLHSAIRKCLPHPPAPKATIGGV